MWVIAIAMMLTFSEGLIFPAFYAAAGDVVDAGNKFCPVSGDKVSKKFFTEYQGKRYGLCCAVCEAKFQKNPEKYLANMKKDEVKG